VTGPAPWGRRSGRSSFRARASTRPAGTSSPQLATPPLGQIKVIPVDYDLIEKESAALKKRFNEIFQ